MKVNRPKIILKTKLVGVIHNHYFDLYVENLTSVGQLYNLIAEPDNQFDKNAVAVHLGKIKLGYICKEDAEQITILIAKKYKPKALLTNPMIKKEKISGKRTYCEINIIIENIKLGK